MHYRLSERGSTTLISLLVLFALISLGLLSLRSTHQEVSSAGNLRQAKQARYVAELGLHHAITLLQQQGSYLLGLRQSGENLLIDSNGDVTYFSSNADDEDVIRRSLNLPRFPAVRSGPGLLGIVQNRIPSYEVRIEGITAGPPPPGQELSQSDLGTPKQHFCLVHFSSRGFIATNNLPRLNRDELSERAWRASLELVAEHRIKAGVVLGPFLIPSCTL